MPSDAGTILVLIPLLTSALNPCFISPMARENNELLTDLLKQVSRSFYLALRVLPKSVRPQISLAYLLARTTDTIADTEIVSVDQRLQLLQALRQRILGPSSTPLNFGELAQKQGSPSERVLLEKCEASLALLQAQSVADQKLIREVLDVITSGHELDLQRFSIATPGKIVALQTDAELDDYTYRVAGCVGRFWTRICLAHQFSTPQTTALSFEELGVHFGKGQQLVNILRDIPADLAKGRCYIPADKLAAAGLVPSDLLNAGNEPKFRPLYNCYLDLTEAYLADSWAYTNLIPFSQMRLRLACAWPILIGVRTIACLRAGNVLDARKRIKISRAEVKKIMLKTVLYYPFPDVWRRLAASKAVATRTVLS
ncbi:MAG TPA: phytoene/squalene synthase family protein [Candidatus Angelobacter sp.]|nr:phytoene/squalene synthase family protein [Candidatus Angelobacter sp.]